MPPVNVIATDEAGYGPNLGPLVIGATCWETPHANFDFGRAFADLVFDSKAALNRSEKAEGRPGLMVADSKNVYSSGRIELLERGVLAFLFAVHDRVPETAIEFTEMVGIDPKLFREAACFESFNFLLPLAANRADVHQLGEQIRSRLKQSHATLEDLLIESVFPQRFNLGLQQHGNKASLLTHHSLDLIAQTIARTKPVNGETLYDIRCDKHGGRNRYAEPIRRQFGDASVVALRQSRESSEYSFAAGRSSIQFAAKGESFFPIALASMVAKYTRELFMRQWNEFWQQHLPEIKPTKGYPLDAKRFKKDIASVQSQLGITDESIWRLK